MRLILIGNRRAIIDLCCSSISKLGDDWCAGFTGFDVYRRTAAQHFGDQLALRNVREVSLGYAPACVVVWASVPCTAGSK